MEFCQEMNKLLFFLSFIFVLFSFTPSFYEIYHAKDLPPDRFFVLEHNYMFDYNFYLSRIREGQEGRWVVVEKYYNQPHQGSLFQIFYLLLGKVGGLFRLSPPVIYNLSRLLLGLMLIMIMRYYLGNFFPGWWQVVAYLLIVTAGSWPIPVKVGNFGRFATYMGWWSAVDSLQRITFIPHVLFGQIFILLFIWRFGGSFFENKSLKYLKLLKWGIVGFLMGIVFPPTLVVVYIFFGVLSFLEIMSLKFFKKLKLKEWIREKGIPRVVFTLFSLPSFLYLQLMFKVLPWKALAIFDIEHRMPLPYKEYFLALGPVLPLGLLGLVIALLRREKRLLPSISWVVSLFLLFRIFENVPTQSPLRFTEAAINIPLGILATYLFYSLWQFGNKCKRSLTFVIRGGIWFGATVIVLMGLGVMVSMVGWLTDQASAKRQATWLVPIGAQLAYPLKDFMEGIYYLRDNTKKEEVVLAYVTAGNFIPAYAGNFVYLGHANTPKEDEKEKVAARFFSEKMSKEEAKEFLQKERVSYVYFGPQERELKNIDDLATVYPFLSTVYKNNQVIIYKFSI